MPSEEISDIMTLLQKKPERSESKKASPEQPSAGLSSGSTAKSSHGNSQDTAKSSSSPAPAPSPPAADPASAQAPDKSSDSKNSDGSKDAKAHDDEKDPVITQEEFAALESKEQKKNIMGFLKSLKKDKSNDDLQNASNSKELEKKLNDALLKIEKLDGKFEMVQSSKSDISDRIGSLSESIGELRSMIFSREEDNSKMEDEFDQIKTAAADMKPEKIRKELDEREKEILEVSSKLELLQQKIDSVSAMIEKQSKTMEKFKSFENMVEISDQIKKDKDKISDSEKYTTRMAAKTEKLFAEVDERLHEFREYKKDVDDTSEMVKDLIRSTDSLEVKSNTLMTKDAFNKSQDGTTKRLDEFDTRIKTLKDIVSSIINKLSRGVSISPDDMKALREDIYGDLQREFEDRIPKDLGRRIDDLKGIESRMGIDGKITLSGEMTAEDLAFIKQDIHDDIIRELESCLPPDLKERLEKMDKKIERHLEKKIPPAKSSSSKLSPSSDDLLEKKLNRISPSSNTDVPVNARLHSSSKLSAPAPSKTPVIDLSKIDPSAALEKLEGMLEQKKKKLENQPPGTEKDRMSSRIDDISLELGMVKMDLLDSNNKSAIDRLKRAALQLHSI